MIRQNRMEFVSNPEHGINLIITSGDKDTGLIDGWPKTKNAKGEATMSIASSNSDTIEMVPFEYPLSSPDDLLPPSADGTRTYIVLYYYDAGKKEIRCELSFSVGMKVVNGFAKVNDWSECSGENWHQCQRHYRNAERCHSAEEKSGRVVFPR